MCKYDVFVQEGGYRLSLSPDHLQSHKNCSQVPQGMKLKISEMYDLKGVDLFGWVWMCVCVCARVYAGGCVRSSGRLT